MNTETIIQFTATFQDNPPCAIKGYQLKNGLAVSHPVLVDSDGDYKYKTGWIIYHVASGLICKSAPHNHKTPADALRYVKNAVPGFLKLLRSRSFGPSPVYEHVLPEPINKLKSYPKPKAAKTETKGYTAYNKLLADIDYALANAFVNSEKMVTFKINRAQFIVGARLEALTRFKANVIRKRKSFADNAFQQPQKAVAYAAPIVAPLTMPELVENCFIPRFDIPTFTELRA